MNFIKKFFDDDAEGSGFGGGDPLNPFEGAKPGDFGKPIEEAGSDDDAGDNVAKSDDKAVADEKVKVEPDKPGVDDKLKVDDKVEPPKKKEAADAVKEDTSDKKVENADTTPQFNFDDELKKADKYEVLKKLGLDDFDIGLLKYKEQTGDVTPYLEAKTVDYTKFSDAEMMKRDLRVQYKSLSDESFDQLYKQEVTDKYILDAEIHGVAAAKLGLELLKHKADSIRQSAISEQAKFKAPEKQVDDSAQKQQLAYDTKIKEYKEYVNDNPATKALLTNKKLVFGTGDAEFNYTVENPQSLVDTAINPQAIFKDLVNKKGNMDAAKFYKVKAYATDPEKIEKMLIDHGKTLGVKEYHEGLTNSSKKDAKAAINLETDLTPAQALARNGKIRQKQD